MFGNRLYNNSFFFSFIQNNIRSYLLSTYITLNTYVQLLEYVGTVVYDNACVVAPNRFVLLTVWGPRVLH